MAIRIPTDQLIGSQSIEAAVSGPDGANRLFVFTGRVPLALTATAQANVHETFTWLLGPQLQRRQFISAVAHISIADARHTANTIGSTGPFGPIRTAIQLAEADWDDESGQVECRAEVLVSAPVQYVTQVFGLSYHVTVLAEINP